MCNTLRIVSKKKIVDYYTTHAQSKTALEDWHSRVNKVGWINFNVLKRDFLNADYVRIRTIKLKPLR